LGLSAGSDLVTAYFEGARLVAFGFGSDADLVLGDRRGDSGLLPPSRLRFYDELLKHCRDCEVCQQNLGRQFDLKSRSQLTRDVIHEQFQIEEAMKHRPDLAQKYAREFRNSCVTGAKYGLSAVDVGSRWRTGYVEAIARAALESKDKAVHAEALRCIQELRGLNALTELGPSASKVKGAIVDSARPLIESEAIEASRQRSRKNGGAAPKQADGIEAVVADLVARNPRATARQLWEGIPNADDPLNKAVLAAGYHVYRTVNRSEEEVLVQETGPKADRTIKRRSFDRYVTKARKKLSLRSK
jgi:hypothetical protein